MTFRANLMIQTVHTGPIKKCAVSQQCFQEHYGYHSQNGIDD